MPSLKDFNTLSELFFTLKSQSNNPKPMLKHKINDKYIDISYSEFVEHVENFAFGLMSLGIAENDKISLISENRPEWVYVDFATLINGAITVPLYPILTSDNIQFILNDSQSIAIVVSNKFHLNKVLKVRNNTKSLKYIIIMGEFNNENNDKSIITFSQLEKLGNNYKKDKQPNLFESKVKKQSENDLCTIIYTSGTTGEPKGVMLTHKNIISNVKAAHEVFSIGADDLFLSFLPLCHIFERMAGYYTALSAGSTIAYAESIEKIGQNMIEIKPTLMTAVPRLFERMFNRIKKNVESQPEKKQKIFNWAIETGKEYAVAKKSDSPMPISLSLKRKLADKLVLSKLRERTGGKLRFMISGGAALARDLGLFFEATGILVIEGYGLTESSPVIAANRPNDYKFGTVGKPFPGVEVKIAKDGEILASGPNIMVGYYNNKKETEATIKDGWLHTGDIGVFDAEGFLIITDRKKHLFKTSGGKYVAPTPIESMFLGSKYIEQFVLIGDRRMFLTALIVPDFEALKEYADANRISYSDPKELVKYKQIYELLDKDLAQFQKNLANFERVRRFTLLDKPFTVEDGELTPKLSVKRKVIEERYSHLIDDMYKGMDV